MLVGLPKEIKNHAYLAGLTTRSVQALLKTWPPTTNGRRPPFSAVRRARSRSPVKRAEAKTVSLSKPIYSNFRT